MEDKTRPLREFLWTITLIISIIALVISLIK